MHSLNTANRSHCEAPTETVALTLPKFGRRGQRRQLFAQNKSAPATLAIRSCTTCVVTAACAAVWQRRIFQQPSLAHGDTRSHSA